MSKEIKADDVVSRMLEIRELRAQAKKEFEAKDRELRKRYEVGENWLLAHMAEERLDKFTAGGATVYTTSQLRPGVKDWEAFKEYLLQSGELDLLQKRISSTNLKELMGDDAPPPPGVSVDTVVTVNLRRS